MNVLVAGGAGYIGSHTCKVLSKLGHNPIVIDDLSTGHNWAVKWGPFYEARIQDTKRVTEILKKEKIEVVVHFAACAYVGESVREPLKYYLNNVSGTLALLDAMKLADVRRIVFSSTCATYGIPKSVPITESETQVPINPYGQSKLMVEQILRSLGESGEMQSVALRYFNAAGADPELEVGEDHSPETHLIPLAIEAAFQGGELKIFGADYPTADGTCIRDYIHVNDLARAHVAAIDFLVQNKNVPFEAFNLGSEVGQSVRNVVKAVEKISGKSIKCVESDRRPGDPPTLVASSQKSSKQLGWQAKDSEIDHIVQTAVQWYEKHFLNRR